jgi:hypothetical protein
MATTRPEQNNIQDFAAEIIRARVVSCAVLRTPTFGLNCVLLERSSPFLAGASKANSMAIADSAWRNWETTI